MQHLCGHYGLAFMMVIRVLFTVGDIHYVIYYSESAICARQSNCGQRFSPHSCCWVFVPHIRIFSMGYVNCCLTKCVVKKTLKQDVGLPRVHIQASAFIAPCVCIQNSDHRRILPSCSAVVSSSTWYGKTWLTLFQRFFFPFFR